MIQPHSSEQILPDLVQVKVICSICHTLSAVELTAREYEDYYTHRKLVQEALPDHTADDRETLSTGTCAGCQKQMSNLIL
jgi:hypothetical protein